MERWEGFLSDKNVTLRLKVRICSPEDLELTPDRRSVGSLAQSNHSCRVKDQAKDKRPPLPLFFRKY